MAVREEKVMTRHTPLVIFIFLVTPYFSRILEKGGSKIRTPPDHLAISLPCCWQDSK